MGIVDVWQSYNARKGEGGTDRYIRVACLSARERKLAAIPPSLTSPSPPNSTCLASYFPQRRPPLRPQLRKAEIWITMTDLQHTNCLSTLQKEKFCKIASETHRRRARVANYTSPVERGEYFWTRLLRDQLRVAKNAAGAAVATRLNPFCNCLAPLKAARTPCPSAKARPDRGSSR